MSHGAGCLIEKLKMRVSAFHLQLVNLEIQNIWTPKKLLLFSSNLKMWFYHRNSSELIYHTTMQPKDADRKANSVDPDKLSRSTLFADPSVWKLRIIGVHYIWVRFHAQNDLLYLWEKSVPGNCKISSSITMLRTLFQ